MIIREIVEDKAASCGTQYNYCQSGYEKIFWTLGTTNVNRCTQTDPIRKATIIEAGFELVAHPPY